MGGFGADAIWGYSFDHCDGGYAKDSQSEEDTIDCTESTSQDWGLSGSAG